MLASWAELLISLDKLLPLEPLEPFERWLEREPLLELEDDEPFHELSVEVERSGAREPLPESLFAVASDPKNPPPPPDEPDERDTLDEDARDPLLDEPLDELLRPVSLEEVYQSSFL